MHQVRTKNSRNIKLSVLCVWLARSRNCSPFLPQFGVMCCIRCFFFSLTDAIIKNFSATMLAEYKLHRATKHTVQFTVKERERGRSNTLALNEIIP